MVLTSDILPSWVDTQTISEKEKVNVGILGFLYLIYTSRVIRMHTLNFYTNLMVQTLTRCEPRGLCRPTGTFPLREVCSLGTQPLQCDCFHQSGNLVLRVTPRKTTYFGIVSRSRQLPHLYYTIRL